VSWTTAYRLALRLLPTALRRKHGPAMEALFACELERARARHWLHGARTGAAGVWDVVRRGAYEHVRPGRGAGGERDGRHPWERWSIDAHGPRLASANIGGPYVPQPARSLLLRRHAALFAIAFLALTTAMLALFATRQVPALTARGASVGTVVEVLLLSVPFTAAITIPMAVLLAVLSEFTRLGADGTLAAARQVRGGVRRLVLPVLAAAGGVAALTLALNTEILPRANARLKTVLEGGPAAGRSDREMTVGELRAAARDARRGGGPDAVALAATYEIEVQKKYALAAACVVLALAGAVIPLRVPRGGAALVIGASGAVYVAYYVSLVTGEDLASRLVVSPFVAMWGANAFVLASALLALWCGRSPLGPVGSRTLSAGG
jgi:lipopolysaccharide export LptBFGC system permease protein LptF